jgi:hypothetical protein
VVRFLYVAAKVGILTEGEDQAKQLSITWEIWVDVLPATRLPGYPARLTMRLLSTFAYGQPIPVNILLHSQAVGRDGLLPCAESEVEQTVQRYIGGLVKVGLATMVRGLASTAVKVHSLLAEVSFRQSARRPR